MRTIKKKQSKCIEKPRQILHKIPINCSGLHVGCENSTKPQEIVMKSTNANIAPLGRRTGCNNPTTNKDMYWKKKHANMAQIATQLVWAEPGMLKFNEKSKVYCKIKQCKYCTNCPSAYWTSSWMQDFTIKSAIVLKSQCKYSTNCKSIHSGGVSDVKIQQNTWKCIENQCNYCTSYQ